MPKVQSCGVIVFQREPLSFLLMKHRDRWDLPKGHVDAGEGELECALRELVEETGIDSADIRLDDQFRFDLHYRVRDKRFPGQVCDKTLTIFLGWLLRDAKIRPTEHIGYQWFPWSPPHEIQTQTIDLLLAAVEQHFRGTPEATSILDFQ